MTEQLKHWDKRIKELMEQVGYPNSMSLYQAFKQFQNELTTSQPAQAGEVTDCMVNTALSAAGFFSTAESRKDMRNALMAALAAQRPAAQAGEVDERVAFCIYPKCLTTGRVCAGDCSKVPTLPAAQATPEPDRDGDAFRMAARLGLTLRFYGGCAQSGMPGSPSAYEVVSAGGDPAAAMREAVERAAAVICAGGEAQKIATPTQQAAGEPVGELTATLPDGIGFDVRWLAHSGPTLKVGDRIYTHPAPGVPEWIVNDLGELGVRVGSRFFFLYKGDNLEYGGSGDNVSDSGVALHDDGTPMRYRTVGKVEFGETCWPVHWIRRGYRDDRYALELVYEPGLSDGTPQDAEWRFLPALAAAQAKGGAA